MWDLQAVWEPAIVTTVVAAPLAMRSVGAHNFRYWRSFSTPWAAFAFIGTFLLLAVVSGTAIVLHRALTGEASWPSDLTAAAVVQAAIRKPNAREPDATTLLLGYLPTIYEWVDEHVGAAIERWATDLDDERLVAAAEHLDNQTSSGRREAPFAFRVRHRDRLKELMAAGGSTRDEGRMQLVYLITEGHRRYRLAKPPTGSR